MLLQGGCTLRVIVRANTRCCSQISWEDAESFWMWVEEQQGQCETIVGGAVIRDPMDSAVVKQRRTVPWKHAKNMLWPTTWSLHHGWESMQKEIPFKKPRSLHRPAQTVVKHQRRLKSLHRILVTAFLLQALPCLLVTLPEGSICASSHGLLDRDCKELTFRLLSSSQITADTTSQGFP